MNRINYDFSSFDSDMVRLKSDQSKSTLDNIKRDLNDFFKDSECKEVIFTKNTDKMFFGMSTYAIMTDYDTKKVITDDEPCRINKYYVEIDSKILDIGLTSKELTAVLLHEVGHLVNDSSPVSEIRNSLDEYLSDIGDEIRLSELSSNQFKYFKFAIQDSLRRITSITTKNDQEILADEFVFMCGYGKELQSAFKKIKTNVPYMGATKTLLGLSYVLKVYKDIGIHRLRAISTLNKLENMTGSELEKRCYDEGIKSLRTLKEVKHECNVIYDRIVISENGIVNESEDGGLVYKIRHGGLKGIEDDLYEFNIRIKNVETEEDAMLILRQMNTRMSVLDDFLTYGNASPKEKERWERVYNKYYDLREEMSKKTIYNKKQYGLWYDYMQLPDAYR